MSKNTKLAIGAIIIVIIAALLYRYGGHKKSAEVIPEPIPVVGQSITSVRKSFKAKPEVVIAPTADTRSYAQLIADYQNRIVQFGDACQVRMSDQVYKLGGEMLLDNRNNMAVTVTIGPDNYELGAYGHKVITLNTEGKFMIDCGANKNVATLTVQK